jgi:hypothetical protein
MTIYQFERTVNRRHWRNRRKTGRLLDCLKDIALECARKVNKDDDYDSLRKKMVMRINALFPVPGMFVVEYDCFPFPLSKHLLYLKRSPVFESRKFLPTQK